MTLYSSFVDSLIIYITEGIALSLFVCTFFIKKRKIRKIINSVGGGLIFILFVFGIFYDLKGFLVLYSLLTIIVLLLKMIIEDKRVKYIWLTLASFVLTAFSVETHIEIMFLLSLCLSIILFLSFTAVSYYETSKRKRTEKEEFSVFSLILETIFSLFLCAPLVFLIVTYDYSQQSINLVKEVINTGINGNLTIILGLFLIMFVFLFIYDFVEDRSEKEWYQ
ncbi:MAG: hypothetical protein ACTSWZ_01900 [Candidatus Heimdallarchaeaceae archaeon]